MNVPATAADVPVDAVAAAAGLTVTRATEEEWREIVAWAASENWNPGDGDLTPFHGADPDGYFLGRVDGAAATAISIVRYDPGYAFLGFYLVRPDLRGRGLGLATWRAAYPHAAGATVGLDAVPAQEATYRRSGFTAAHRTLRYGGCPRPGATPAGHAVPVTAALLDAVVAYDRGCFPADRAGFVRAWLTAPGRHARAAVRDGRVTGYGLVRPARDGHRIGPLFADTPEDAAAVFDALTAALPDGATVHLDVPEPSHAAVEFAGSRGLSAGSHTVRMYAGEVPGHRTGAVWAVTSLELG